MNVNELFYSIQGEGTFTGRPSIFIRTSGCNLACIFCDTPYTSHDPEQEYLEVWEIVQKIEELRPDCHHIVITGGEPMMQKDLPDLVNSLKKRGNMITIETNGTIWNPEVKPDLFSVSPKTSNSIPYDIQHEKKDFLIRKHIKHNAFEHSIPPLIESGIDYQMKFVIQSREDLKEIEEFNSKFNIPNSNVFLMPEGTTRESQRNKAFTIAEICKEYGYNFCPRVHIEIWGPKRGV